MKYVTATMVAVLLTVLAAAQAPREVAAARQNRDHANIAGLEAMARQAAAQAASAKSAAAYVWVAQLDSWQCEAELDRGQSKAVAATAQAGVDAAKRAAALAPNNADAQRLEGGLLGQLISQGGAMAGMQYGMASEGALEKALALAPKDPKVLVTRAISYLFTPAAFGGSPAKAVQLLQQAAALDPHYDTPHIWLAEAYLMQHQTAAAGREVAAALRIDPGRMFTLGVRKQLQSAPASGRRGGAAPGPAPTR